MKIDLSAVHLHWRSHKKGGKEYISYSLARSVWNGTSTRKVIVLKLGKLSEPEVLFWREAIKQAKVRAKGVPADTQELTTIPVASDTKAPKSTDTEKEVMASKKFSYDDNDRRIDIQSSETYLCGRKNAQRRQ